MSSWAWLAAGVEPLALTLTLTPALSLFSVFPPRKPSFPFQWAWESFITRTSTPAQPGASLDPSAPGFPQLRHRSAASLPEALGFCRKLEAQNLEKRQQPGGWGASPLSKGESPGLQVPHESTLWPPRKSARPELEWAEAEEPERDLSPSELPQLPLRALTLEEELFSDMPGEDEEGEHQASQTGRRPGPQNKGQNCGEEASSEGHGCGHGSGSSGLGGSQRRKVKVKELQGPWDLEMPRRRLQQSLDCGECATQCLGSPRSRGADSVGPSRVGQRQACLVDQETGSS